MRRWLRHWLGLDVTDLFIADIGASVKDINVRMEHLAKRMDEAEVLLKRVHNHIGRI